MKRLLKILGFLTVLVLLLFLANRYLLSGRSSFQSIYLVPSNAAWIIESEAPFNAWDKIVHSNAWQTISQVEVFKELNEDILSIDSVFNDQIVLLKAIGKHKAMISAHEYLPGKFDYLYILNLGKITRLRNPENIISSFLGEKYPVTKRPFRDQIIYEMFDRESGEMYIFCFIHDKIIFSTNYKLVEASVNEMEKMTLGRDLAFIDVSKRISGKGLFNLYINYNFFPGYLRSMLGKTTEEFSALKNELTYSAFAFDISNEGLLSLEGFTGVNDTVSSFYSSALKAGSNEFESTGVIPARVASLVKIGFDNASDYYTNSLADLNSQEYASYMATLQKMEKKLNISVNENLLSWIDNEIVLLQTQPSNLGRTNEFAAFIKAKNGHDAQINMEFIGKQIKRNSPVKVKEVAYKGFKIFYISFPGLIKTLFGKMLQKIEKPYYTQIDNYVIFSNHPQTLKNIIDDYTDRKTLAYSDSYKQFVRPFDRRNTVFAYLDVPVLFNNLKEFVSGGTWQKLIKNKPYITSFSQAGIQIEREDDLLHLKIAVQYNPQFENYSQPRFDESFLTLFSLPDTAASELSMEHAWFNPEIVINDLDDKRMEVKDDKGILLYSIELKEGMKHGAYREYFPDGSVKITGKYKNDLQQGTWKLYNEEGKLEEEKEF